jgi:hypothetical protein
MCRCGPVNFLPGEIAPVLPFFAAPVVATADLTAAKSLVEGNGIATALLDGFFVSAADAHGTAVGIPLGLRRFLC